MWRAASAHDVTLLLRAWSEGDAQAANRLPPFFHRELHRIARGCISRECPDHTLQATALVKKACLGLVEAQPVSGQHRTRFFALCARAMRRILKRDWSFARMRLYGELHGVKPDAA